MRAFKKCQWRESTVDAWELTALIESYNWKQNINGHSIDLGHGDKITANMIFAKHLE